MSNSLTAQGVKRAGRALAARFAAWGRDEHLDMVVWAPAFVGAGAASYLCAPFEPPMMATALIAAALIVAGLALLAWRATLAAFALVAAGVLLADIRAAIVAAPVLERAAGVVSIEGRLLTLDEGASSRRLVLAVEEIEGLSADATPRRIRLTARSSSFSAAPGDLVRVRADLSPPPSPVAPGAFDFARHLYFQEIGAVGFMLGPPQILPQETTPPAARVAAFVESFRVRLTRRILDAAPGQGGAIVAALVTGKRSAIDEATDAALRDSGLAHLLSISGLHMSMATGLIFFTLRAALALAPSVALRHPIKKWAAAFAILGGFAYLMFSGLAWAAQRAFIMAAIVFVAIIADRRALSLRNVAVAALIILLTAPESVVHPGFQMSFAAVTALIAWYEWSSGRADPRRSFAAPAKVRRYFLGIAATDTIAAAATAPFGLFHFHRTANFGLPANIVAIPLTGFFVMPAAILALLAWPFGFDAPFWRFAAEGAETIIAAARWASSLPGAVSTTPHWSGGALAVIAVGGLILCLLTTPLRLAGFLALPVAAALVAVDGPPPDLFVSASGRNVGLVERAPGNARMIVYDRRRDRFQIEAWAEFSGLDPEATPTRMSDAFSCDPVGCVLRAKGATLAVSAQAHGLFDDCARAALVIALHPVREREACRARLISRVDIWRDGAHGVWLGPEGAIRVRSVGATRRTRPWAKGDQ